HLTVLAAALLTATAALDDPGGPARDALASFHAAVRAAGGHAPLSDLLGAIVLAHVRATLATIPARH
ncbi:MAG: hypothetical protein ACRERC_16190, partial [Candidatus Binatia bacterium]